MVATVLNPEVVGGGIHCKSSRTECHGADASRILRHAMTCGVINLQKSSRDCDIAIYRRLSARPPPKEVVPPLRLAVGTFHALSAVAITCRDVELVRAGIPQRCFASRPCRAARCRRRQVFPRQGTPYERPVRISSRELTAGCQHPAPSISLPRCRPRGSGSGSGRPRSLGADNAAGDAIAGVASGIAL